MDANRRRRLDGKKNRAGDVGGNSLRFFGGKISPSGQSILGHGYQCNFHIWHQDLVNTHLWVPGVVAGGHFGQVRDLTWEPFGQFLITVSSDQTTRVHVPWHHKDDKTIEFVSGVNINSMIIHLKKKSF